MTLLGLQDFIETLDSSIAAGTGVARGLPPQLADFVDLTLGKNKSESQQTGEMHTYLSN